MSKKGQSLTILMVQETKDYFGVYEVTVNINGREYTYPITSEYILRKIKKQLRYKRYGKALHMLNQFITNGYNFYKEDLADVGLDTRRTRVCAETGNSDTKSETSPLSSGNGEVQDGSHTRKV